MIGRMFRSDFIMIVDLGAKLVNGMVKHKDYLLRGPYHGNNSIFLLNCHGVRWQVQLGRVGPDRVAVIRPAWSKFMRRNVDQDVRLLHFVEEGHDTFYVATYNKYGLENHAYKETKYATAIREKSVPSIRIIDGGSCAQPQEVIPSDIVKTYKLYGYALAIVTNKDAQYEFELRWGKVSNLLKTYSSLILRKMKEIIGFMADQWARFYLTKGTSLKDGVIRLDVC
ncbi:hypothetical protein Tco_1117415 [Tanacetum coccineum]